MNLEVRLYATLRKYLPAGGDGLKVRLDMPAGASTADVLAKLGIPAESAFLVLIDGRHESDRCRPLEDGRTLSIWPPIAGG